MPQRRSSFVDSPAFGALAPHIRIETYDRDGGHQHPRKRIELGTKAPPSAVAMALTLELPCVACGRSIHPFRQRVAASKRSHHVHVYFAAACPLGISVGCSRGREARDEYLRVVEAVKVTALFEAEPEAIFVGEMEDEMDDAKERPEPADVDPSSNLDCELSIAEAAAGLPAYEASEVAAMQQLSVGAGIFDESAIWSAAQDREDQLMGALIVLRSDVDALRWRVNALALALAIVIAVIMGSTYVVLR